MFWAGFATATVLFLVGCAAIAVGMYLVALKTAEPETHVRVPRPDDGMDRRKESQIAKIAREAQIGPGPLGPAFASPSEPVEAFDEMIRKNPMAPHIHNPSLTSLGHCLDCGRPVRARFSIPAMAWTVEEVPMVIDPKVQEAILKSRLTEGLFRPRPDDGFDMTRDGGGDA